MKQTIKPVPGLFRLLALGLGCYGILAMINGGVGDLYIFFTMQSNILVLLMWLTDLVLFLASFLREKETTLPAPLRTAVTMYIVITMVVYWFILGGSFSMNGTLGISNVIIHLFVPLLAVADWIFFCPHGRITFKHTLWFLSYPFAYMVFIYIRAWIVTDYVRLYPYPFMNIDLLGVGQVAIYLVIMGVCFYLLALLFLFCDSLLSPKNSN